MRPSLVFLLTAILLGCASNGQQRLVASDAAVAGVGGVLGSAIFRGDVDNAVLRATAWGAGGVSGAPEDQVQLELREQIERIRLRLGPDNFLGIESLVECRHDQAILHAKTATRSLDNAQVLIATWLEALIEADRGRMDLARAQLPALVASDPLTDSPADAERLIQETLSGLRQIRLAFHLPATCDEAT